MVPETLPADLEGSLPTVAQIEAELGRRDERIPGDGGRRDRRDVVAAA